MSIYALQKTAGNLHPRPRVNCQSAVCALTSSLRLASLEQFQAVGPSMSSASSSAASESSSDPFAVVPLPNLEDSMFSISIGGPHTVQLFFICFPQLPLSSFGFSLNFYLLLFNPMGYVALYFSIAASRSLISWVTFSRMPGGCYSMDSVRDILGVAKQPLATTLLLHYGHLDHHDHCDHHDNLAITTTLSDHHDHLDHRGQFDHQDHPISQPPAL